MRVRIAGTNRTTYNLMRQQRSAIMIGVNLFNLVKAMRENTTSQNHLHTTTRGSLRVSHFPPPWTGPGSGQLLQDQQGLDHGEI